MIPRKVLLIGWDAADWKVIHPLLDGGQMPNLASIIEQGVMADCTTLEPVLSPMLWTSIGTGKRADAHGILGFTEIDPQTGNVRPVSSTSRRTKALWNILMQNGWRTHTVNWWASHPAEPLRGVSISNALIPSFAEPGQPWPLFEGTVSPPEFAETVAGLRVHLSELDDELLRLFVPRAAEVDQERDPRLALVARLQAETYSVHAAATWALHTQPWDFAAIFYPGIDHFSHGFMDYHPPRQEWMPERDFELFSDVVASAYRMHDLMLGTLLHLAGPDTAVVIVSDHGFHSDHLRRRYTPDTPSGPAGRHRRIGIFAMKGPGIVEDERIYGVSLLDIAPTILAWCGLPAGFDMPGRVLAEAFSAPPLLERIESWDNVPGDCGMHPGGETSSPADACRLLQRFVDLGYIEAPTGDERRNAEITAREQNWNLVRVYTSTRNFDRALPLLEQLHADVPERQEWGLTLADCQGKVGLLDEALATVQEVIAGHADTTSARWVLGITRFARGEYEEALEDLHAAQEANSREPGLHINIGGTYLRMRRWTEAQRAYERALEIDPHAAVALEGLAMALLRQKDYRAAAEKALDAVGLQHELPLAHFSLGIALLHLGHRDRAIQAFETCLTLPPPVRAAHGWLARIYSRMPGEEGKAREHMRLARDLIHALPRAQLRQERIREEARLRARERARRPAPQKPVQTEAPLEFTIVSGLPRSGKSAMLDMLAGAGVPVLRDWEPIRRLREHPEVFRKAAGKALAVPAALLEWLPGNHHYRLIFMDRPLDEILSSLRLDESLDVDTKEKKARFVRHRFAVLDRMSHRRTCSILLVDYPELLKEPEGWARQIAAFLGLPEDAASQMAARVRPELRHHSIAG